MAPVSQPVDPALASQLSNHKLFDGSCDGRTITATVFLNDTRKCPAMLGRIAVTKVQRCKHPDSVEHEVVLSEVVCLDDARKPIDHAIVSFERYIKAVGKPNPSSAKRRPLAKTSADVRASSSDSSCGSGENSAADTLCSYHSKSFPTIEGRKLTVMSEMVFPIDGENIFLIEEFATMAEVISASAPVYNVATTNCYWFASSLMEMAVQEKAGKIKILQTKQKAGTVRGVDVNFQPHPSQKVPALRVKYAESWERYQGDIQIAKLRIEQERDELLKPTQDEVRRERAEKERERAEKEDALRREEGALRREEGALRREEGALRREEDALRRAEAAEAKLALLTSMQTS